MPERRAGPRLTAPQRALLVAVLERRTGSSTSATHRGRHTTWATLLYVERQGPARPATLQGLVDQGYLTLAGAGYARHWVLTPAGLARAQQARAWTRRRRAGGRRG